MNDNYIDFKEKPTIRYFKKFFTLLFIVGLFFVGYTGSAQCIAPTIDNVTSTDPTCTTGGQITIAATDNNAGAYGVLEYSIDNGATWQSSNTFNGLAADSYNIIVRHANDHSCSTTYTSNPLTLNSAVGCSGIVTTSISSCNQGYTKDGEYKITYSISIANNSYFNEVRNIQLTNDLNSIFGTGSINQIDRNDLSVYNRDGNTYPYDYDGSDWDAVEFDATDPTPGDNGIFNSTSVANDVLYPRQVINISYCVYVDPVIAGGLLVGSGNGVAFDNIINVTTDQNNATANVNITDFHTTETTVSANLYVPDTSPQVNWDGTYDFTNTVIIKNDGTATANNVQFFLPMNPIVDDNGDPITINTQTVTKVSGPASIDVNPFYDGHDPTQTGITNGGFLPGGEVAIFSIAYNVGPTVDNGWSPFNVVNPSMTQGGADGDTEDPNVDTYVQWTDAEGNHLDRYYQAGSATDEPSSTSQCSCPGISMRFPYNITLTLDKSIESDVPAASGILGNRDITFRLKAKNDASSEVRLTNLHLIDDLQAAFGANLVNVSTPNLIHVNAEQDPNLNPAYDGQGNNDIFDGNSGILNPGEEVWVDITVELSRGVNSNNTASFYGNDPNAITVAQASSAVSVTVLNQPPVATDDSVTTPEDTTVSGNVINDNLGNGTDSDPENDPLTVTQFVVNGTTYTIPANGSATANLPEGDLTINSDGNFTFVPAPNYNGAVPQATYTIDDGNGGTDTATLDINVTPVNDVPVAYDDNTSTNEDTPVNGDVSDNDTPSGDGGNTWAVATQPANGTVTMNPDGTYTYTPNPNFNGSDSFTYTITDADGDTSTATVVIVVNPVNDVPVATDDNATTDEDTPVSGSVAGNDTPSGDGGNTWSVTGQPAHGTVTMDSNGNYTYTPDPDYNGPDSFTYQVCDVDGDCSPATVNLTVNPVNDPPVAEDDSDETMINTPVTINILNNDDDPNDPAGNIDPTSVTITTQPSNGTVSVDPNTGEVTYTPNPGFFGNDTFEYQVCDDGNPLPAQCTTATVNVFVQNPELTVTKEDAIPANATVGDDVTYTIVVTNTGNVPVTSIDLQDSNAVPATITVGDLAPGEHYIATVTHTITQADMNAGGFDNQATATGTDPNGNPVIALSDDPADPTDNDSDGDGHPDDPTHTDLTPYQVGEITTTLDDNDPSSPGNPSTYFAGDDINYNLNVSNTGNVDLGTPNVPAGYTYQSGDDNNDGILNPGETWVYTGSHTLTQNEIDSGSYSEQFSITTGDASTTAGNITATDNASDDPQTNPDNDPTITYFDLQDEIEVKKQDQLPVFVQVGQSISYTITVTNNGNSSVLNLTVTDDNSDAAPVYQSGDVNNDNRLNPGEIWTYTASHTITQADMDAGMVANVAQASGQNPAGDPVEDLASDDPDTPQPDDPTISDLSSYQMPALSTLKTVANYIDNGLAGVSAGDVIEYQISVINTGNITLNSITLIDNLIINNGGSVTYVSGDLNTDNNLDVGETWVYTASYTVTQSDVDAGMVENSATAYGLDTNGLPVHDISDPLSLSSDNPTITTLTQNPSITVTKEDALPANVAVGEYITYTIVVTNTGNVTLTNIRVDDSNAVMNGVGSTPVLLPGDSVTFTAVHQITQDDMNNGSVTNQATATGTDPNGNDVSDLSDDTDPAAGPGDQDPTVTDLTPYQTVSMEVTLDDNLQTDPSNPYNFNAGDEINYTAELTNTGNVSITPTTPAGYTPVEQGGVNIGDTNGDGVLDPGETWVYETSHTVTQSDIDAGQVDNQVTFDGVGLNGDNVSDVSDDPQDNTTTTDDVTVTYIGQNPELTVVKTGEFVDSHPPLNGLADVGEVINYTIVVTNSGNVTLTDVVVTDPNATNITPATIGTMAPGDVVTVTAQHELTQADIDAGEVINQATATGNDPTNNPVSDISDDPNTGVQDDPTIVGVPVHAEITVEKTGQFNDENGDGFANVGETITYTFNVTNAGNQTISDLDVSDPLLGGVTLVLTNGDTNGNHLLDVGEVWTYTADYILTQADIDVGFIDNQALAMGVDPQGNALTDLSDDPNNPINDDVENDGEPDDVTHTILPQNPDLDIQKIGHFNDENGDGLAQVGETISYLFIVTNIGNVTLSDISIDDPLVTVNGGPIILAPGDSNNSSFTAVYTLTASDIGAGYVTNSATVMGYDPQGDLATDVSDDPNNPTNVDPDGDGNPDDPTVVSAAGLIINTIFTPNGDGVNDTWVLTGIENFPYNTVRVYNRWGNLVYESEGYMNDWDGHSNGRAIMSEGKLLPVGTYFYVIDLGNGMDKFTGYLYLNR